MPTLMAPQMYAFASTTRHVTLNMHVCGLAHAHCTQRKITEMFGMGGTSQHVVTPLRARRGAVGEERVVVTTATVHDGLEASESHQTRANARLLGPGEPEGEEKREEEEDEEEEEEEDRPTCK